MMITASSSCFGEDVPKTKSKPVDVPTEIRKHLGNQLQTYFSLPADEPLPERLTHLVIRFEQAVSSRGEPTSGPFHDSLVTAMPGLRAFAFSLVGDMTRTDDLVQETLIKAWTNQHRFEPGSNLIAWLFTILRNQFYTDIRKRKREIEDADGVHASQLIALPDQDDTVALKRLYEKIATLPVPQREALLLVGAEGFTYEQAAERLQCQVGTVKSRVSRARAHLAEVLGFTPRD